MKNSFYFLSIILSGLVPFFSANGASSDSSQVKTTPVLTIPHPYILDARIIHGANDNGAPQWEQFAVNQSCDSGYSPQIHLSPNSVDHPWGKTGTSPNYDRLCPFSPSAMPVTSPVTEYHIENQIKTTQRGYVIFYFAYAGYICSNGASGSAEKDYKYTTARYMTISAELECIPNP